jgi:Fe-S cluster biogenesis protein NfuA
MKDQIEEVLDQVRPQLRMDGGGIELVDVNEETGVVRVKLQGACASCPMSEVTLKMGIEVALKDAIPSITEVIAVE